MSPIGPVYSIKPFMPKIQPGASPGITPTGLPQFNQFGATTPNFNDILKNLQKPINVAPLPTMAAPGAAGSELFERGITELGPRTGLRPEAQTALDIISERTARARRAGVSGASALAARRGLAGSTIEQFGVSEAGAAAERAGREAEIPILLENVRQQEAARQLRSQHLAERAKQLEQLTSTQEISRLQMEANRGNKQAEIELNQRMTEAKLVSDEIASQRNIDFQLEQLEIQRIIGERGLAASQANIEAARQIARQESKDQLLGNVISTFGPGVLFGTGGGGGLFSGGASGDAGAKGGGGLLSGFMGTTPFGAAAPGMVAPTTTGTASAAGLGTFSTASPTAAGGPLAGVTTGSMIAGAGMGYLGSRTGQTIFGKERGAAAGAPIGAAAGFILGGPLGAAIGGVAGAGVGKGVGRLAKGIKKAFPF